MTSNRFIIALAMFGIMGVGSIGLTADRHHGTDGPSMMPTEAGQDAFAALAEIVAILNADPATDWSKVDIAALREHLVDMNALTLSAVTDQQSRPDGLTITVTGIDRTRNAIQLMVPAHAAELDRIEGWSATTEIIDEGAVLTVTSSDPAEQVKIQGLGFFGLMVTGSHHQPHHLAIARGQGMAHGAHQHHQ